MHYYIDGYNLLFKTLRSNESLQEARDALIDDINEKASKTNMPITIVFDAHYQEENLSITHYHSLEIIYSAHSQTADDLIINILKSIDNPKSCTLVTSDNKLAWRARQLHVKTEKVVPFLELLNRRYENKLKKKVAKPTSLSLTPLIKNRSPESQKNDTQRDYEAIFNKRYEEFESKRKRQKTADSTKEPKKEKPLKDSHLSEFNRWLNIFEKKASEEEDNGA